MVVEAAAAAGAAAAAQESKRATPLQYKTSMTRYRHTIPHLSREQREAEEGRRRSEVKEARNRSRLQAIRQFITPLTYITARYVHFVA